MDRKGLFKFAIFSLLAIGIGIASVSSTNAQRRNRWDGYPNWGGSYQLRETALNAGYNEGQKQGRDDRSHNRYRTLRSSARTRAARTTIARAWAIEICIVAITKTHSRTVTTPRIRTTTTTGTTGTAATIVIETTTATTTVVGDVVGPATASMVDPLNCGRRPCTSVKTRAT